MGLVYWFIWRAANCLVLSSASFSPLRPAVSASCCRPPRHRATAPLARGMPHVTRLAPSATSTCDGYSISDKWTLSLPCGRCSTYSHHRRGSTAISTTGNRPRTSGPGTTLLSWFCLVSGFVVRHMCGQGLAWVFKLLFCFHWLIPFVPCSVNNRLWSGVGYGSPGDPEAAAVGGLCRLYRSWSTHINLYVVSG